MDQVKQAKACARVDSARSLCDCAYSRVDVIYEKLVLIRGREERGKREVAADFTKNSEGKQRKDRYK